MLLGSQLEKLAQARHTVDALAIQVLWLTEQLRFLQPVQRSTSLSASHHEPRINNPPVYAGEPTNCRSILIPCEVVFSLQSQTYASDTSGVTYVISLLTGSLVIGAQLFGILVPLAVRTSVFLRMR